MTETDQRTISGDFNERNYTKNGFGVSNTQLNTVEYEKDRRSAKERLGDYIDEKSSYIKRAGRYTNQVGREYGSDNRNKVREGGARIYKTGQEGKQLAKQIKNVKTSARATAVGIAVASWTMFLWFWVLLPLSLFILFIFGSYYALSDTMFGFMAGYFVDATGLFMWLWIVLIGISITIHIGAVLHYAIAGLAPIFGRGSAVKTTTFLLSFVTSIIPGVAIIPTILMWEMAVEVYPN